MAGGTYRFDIPTQNRSIIKVIGVGGGGSNAVNNMFKRGIKDVSFVICNTDSQALESSPVPNKLQIGINLTEGLGAGANPEVGRNAAIESKEEIKKLLSDNTKMVFITAGMGGGTGTGAAPVIASVAQKLGILTVGIVTLPFNFEGKQKINRAKEGIAQLKTHCDTVLVILNDRLKKILGNLSIGNAFAQADNILTTAAKSIAEIITVSGYVNVDFEDVKTVMKNAGAAVMGSGSAEGDGRAMRAAEEALSSPLLDYKDIHGAKKILLSIVSGEEAELQMDELATITDYIQERVGTDSEMIFGHGSDPQLKESIRVTVIATGFSNDLHTIHKGGQSSEEKQKNEDTKKNEGIFQKNNTYFATGESKEKAIEYFDGQQNNTSQNRESFKQKERLYRAKKASSADKNINVRQLNFLQSDIENPFVTKNTDLIHSTNGHKKRSMDSLHENYNLPAYLRKNISLSAEKVNQEVKRYHLEEDDINQEDQE